MIHLSEKTCPRCQSLKMKNWPELTDDEKFLAERLPMSAQYTPNERKKHRFCTQCWFEETENKSRIS